MRIRLIPSVRFIPPICWNKRANLDLNLLLHPTSHIWKVPLNTCSELQIEMLYENVSVLSVVQNPDVAMKTEEEKEKQVSSATPSASAKTSSSRSFEKIDTSEIEITSQSSQSSGNTEPASEKKYNEEDSDGGEKGIESIRPNEPGKTITIQPLKIIGLFSPESEDNQGNTFGRRFACFHRKWVLWEWSQSSSCSLFKFKDWSSPEDLPCFAHKTARSHSQCNWRVLARKYQSDGLAAHLQWRRLWIHPRYAGNCERAWRICRQHQRRRRTQIPRIPCWYERTSKFDVFNVRYPPLSSLWTPNSPKALKRWSSTKFSLISLLLTIAAFSTSESTKSGRNSLRQKANGPAKNWCEMWTI